MRPEDVEELISQLSFAPLTSAAAGRLLYEFVAKDGIEQVLELGCAHGTSTAYMAAALDEKGVGWVRTYDRDDARDRDPNVFAVLSHLGLEGRVEPILSTSSYTWELMRVLDEQTYDLETRPKFDLCFLDGAHTWETDGLAFLLIDRLLHPDRWILFDDVSWTLGSSPTLKHTPRVQAMSEDERATPHVRKIIDLLVRPLGYRVQFVGNIACAYKPGRGDGPSAHDGDFKAIASSQREGVRCLAFGSLRRRGGLTDRELSPGLRGQSSLGASGP